jgi:hypothetical protein
MATSYTVDSILKSLGYADPLVAARQQARIILLGRHARFQAEIQQLERKWNLSLVQMKEKYETVNAEDFDADDDYLQWQWNFDRLKAIEKQLEVLSAA